MGRRKQKKAMLGKDVIKWIIDNHAEETPVWVYGGPQLSPDDLEVYMAWKSSCGASMLQVRKATETFGDILRRTQERREEARREQENSGVKS